jgi:hypothetical protein
VICEICGKDSGDKPKCLSCWKAANSGEFTRCLKCGKWKADSKPVCISCWKSSTDSERKEFAAKAATLEKQRAAAEKNAGSPPQPKKTTSPNTMASAKTDAAKSASSRTAKVIAAESDKTLCAVCGENSKGKTLCYSCYEREKSGEITKCVDCGKWKNNRLQRCRDCWEKEQKTQGDRDFRQKYPDSPKYRCKQGILVRSKAEVVIADFLYDNKIQFRYETMRMLGDIEVHPDFYLEEVDVFLEHCGMDSADYIAKRHKKEQLYAAHKQQFVTTNKEDESELHDALKRKLHKHFPGKQLK